MLTALLDRAFDHAPGALGDYYSAYKVYRWGDPYIRLVARLADRSRLAVDVGAHNGDYTFFMRRHARACLAFECNPALASQLRRRFGATVDIRADAVSDERTTTVLRIPRRSGEPNLGRATIEPGNDLGREFSDVDLVTVNTVRLDDVIDQPVGLLKVDVEGHELAVLHGAKRILEQDRPNLIVELEDRHVPGCVAEAMGFLHGLGYRAHHLHEGKLREIAAGQTVPHGLWNFVFTPDGPKA